MPLTLVAIAVLRMSLPVCTSHSHADRLKAGHQRGWERAWRLLVYRLQPVFEWCMGTIDRLKAGHQRG